MYLPEAESGCRAAASVVRRSASPAARQGCRTSCAAGAARGRDQKPRPSMPRSSAMIWSRAEGGRCSPHRAKKSGTITMRPTTSQQKSSARTQPRNDLHRRMRLAGAPETSASLIRLWASFCLLRSGMIRPTMPPTPPSSLPIRFHISFPPFQARPGTDQAP